MTSGLYSTFAGCPHCDGRVIWARAEAEGLSFVFRSVVFCDECGLQAERIEDFDGASVARPEMSGGAENIPPFVDVRVMPFEIHDGEPFCKFPGRGG